MDKLTIQGAAAVGLGGTLENLVAIAERVTETAELFANLSKCITGFSTIFQLVSLSAKGVSMCVEASRGQRVLSVALGSNYDSTAVRAGKIGKNHEALAYGGGDSCRFRVRCIERNSACNESGRDSVIARARQSNRECRRCEEG